MDLAFTLFSSITFDKKFVLLRADLNVPLKNGTILDDYRLTSILPTIKQIQEKKGTVILATHIGRPKGHEAALSTKYLIPWFEKHGFEITFSPDLRIHSTMQYSAQTIILLENLRFFSGEQTTDQKFAQQLADLADYYVNDAFALLHRTDTSITLVPQLFDKNKKMFGPLVLREIQNLNKLIHEPAQPFLVLLGGGKVSTKLPLINNLIGKAHTIFIGPATVFTFLKGQNIPVGLSLVEAECIPETHQILEHAAQKGTHIIFPQDYQVAQKNISGPLSIVAADAIPANAIGVSIGPKTIAQLMPNISRAKTIFFNCAMGFLDKPQTLDGTKKLIELIAQSSAYSVIGGGESVAIAEQSGYATDIDFLSTGGGATLAYLSGEKLPGLMSMKIL